MTEYIHLDDSLSVKKGDWVIRGQKIGVVGGKIKVLEYKKGAHLHYTQWKGDSGVRATFNGVDTVVYAGAADAYGNYPTENLESAYCMVPPFGARVTAVSRDSNCLDIFVVGTDGRILAVAWERKLLDGNWRGWWHMGLGKTSKDAEIAPVSRGPNKLDVFFIGTNGLTYTAAWEKNVMKSEWRGWCPIGNLKAPPGSAVSAVSRAPNKSRCVRSGQRWYSLHCRVGSDCLGG